MKQNKYVQSWWVEIIKNDIYQLTFNLTERWLNYHRYDNETYSFGLTNEEINFDNTIVIPKFLPDISRTLYIPSHFMEKDQLTFYFIPINFEDRKKNRNIILESKIEL
jgi:hypothetical protein